VNHQEFLDWQALGTRYVELDVRQEGWVPIAVSGGYSIHPFTDRQNHRLWQVDFMVTEISLDAMYHAECDDTEGRQSPAYPRSCEHGRIRGCRRVRVRAESTRGSSTRVREWLATFSLLYGTITHAVKRTI
jgi:hypothetical protein